MAKKKGLLESLREGVSKTLGSASKGAAKRKSGSKKTASRKPATAKKAVTARKPATAKKAVTARKPATAKKVAVSKKVARKIAPKSIKRLVKKAKSSPTKQTAAGKAQDKRFIALPPGYRKASKTSVITKADGTTFKRKNPNAVEGNIYLERRANRSDTLGKVARKGGKMC